MKLFLHLEGIPQQSITSPLQFLVTEQREQCHIHSFFQDSRGEILRSPMTSGTDRMRQRNCSMWVGKSKFRPMQCNAPKRTATTGRTKSIRISYYQCHLRL